MGGHLTKEDNTIESSSPLTFRNPFDLNKESETQSIVKVTEVQKEAGDGEDEDDLDFDPNNYDPKTVGPILPNGDINWECPCLGGAAHGPCGTEFRQAFSCFHYSQEDPKGSDCFPQFREMHVCFSKFPQLYPTKDDDDDEEEGEDENEENKEDDPIKFDEEELKLINEEDSRDKESKKQEDSKSEQDPAKENVKEKKELVRREIRPKENVPTPPQAAAVM